jgi:multidrug efflux pump subunit AcrA (membrane-fusion protein)
MPSPRFLSLLTALTLAAWVPPASAQAPAPTPPQSLAPAVTVATAAERELAEQVIVTGTLVPREEILVTPEVEGLRIVEVRAEEGDVVQAGQVLARLRRRSPRTTRRLPAPPPRSPRREARSSRPRPPTWRPSRRWTARRR